MRKIHIKNISFAYDQNNVLENLNNRLVLPIKWKSENFVPYNYGYFKTHGYYH